MSETQQTPKNPPSNATPSSPTCHVTASRKEGSRDQGGGEPVGMQHKFLVIGCLSLKRKSTREKEGHNTETTPGTTPQPPRQQQHPKTGPQRQQHSNKGNLPIPSPPFHTTARPHKRTLSFAPRRQKECSNSSSCLWRLSPSSSSSLMFVWGVSFSFRHPFATPSSSSVKKDTNRGTKT